MDHPHRLDMSPILVGLLGILTGAIRIAICHCIVVRCNTRDTQTPTTNDVSGRENETAVNSSTAEHSAIQVIVQSNKYLRECRDDLCAICLGEFKEGEVVRVLCECAHVFHLMCVDKWLENHRSCPLCRASAIPPPLRNADLSPAAEMNRAPPDFGGSLV